MARRCFQKSSPNIKIMQYSNGIYTNELVTDAKTCLFADAFCILQAAEGPCTENIIDIKTQETFLKKGDAGPS